MSALSAAIFALAIHPVQESQLTIDPLLIKQVDEIWTVIGSDKNEIWPGWNARKTPILIYMPDQQDVLINHPKPPAGFTRYSGPIKSKIGPIYISNGKTLIEWDGQNTAIDVNGVQTLVVADTLSTRRQWVQNLVPVINADPNNAEKTITSNLAPNPYRSMSVFAHEAFHVYQHSYAEKMPNEMVLTRYDSLSTENNAGFALESDFLAKALRAKDKREMRKSALSWLAVRMSRRKSQPKEAADYEDCAEFEEGLAVYIEYRIFEVLKKRQPSAEMWLLQRFRGYGILDEERDNLIKAMQGYMSGTNIVNNDLYGASPVRFRLYYSGMAVAALLDRLSANWKNDILNKSETLTSLAAKALGAKQSELDTALEEAKKSLRYGQLEMEKAKLRQDGLEHIVKAASEFDAAPGTVTLDYSLAGSAEPQLQFTPFGILRIDDSKCLFRLIPVRGSVAGTTFAEDGARPVMFDSDRKQIRLMLTSWPAELNNRKLRDEELRLPGVTLKHATGQLSVEGHQITINLEKSS